MSQATAVLGSRSEYEEALHRGKVGMICLFVSEAHIFGALIVAFLLYLPQSRASATPPAEVLSLGLASAGTVCLLLSSGTVHLATGALRRGGFPLFCVWWMLTIVLGCLFLTTTAIEWKGLIVDHGLTLRLNLFGSTYFSLVGFHAFHVTIGVIALLVVLVLAGRSAVTAEHNAGAELISWYWHFVDGVWVVVFSVVYLVSR